MTSLTPREIAKQFPVSSSEVAEYLKKHHLPKIKKYKLRATNAIRASKIRRALGRDYTETNTVGEWQAIYGRARVNGALTFVSTTNNNQNLHLIITVACHEIDAIEKIYFDEEEIVFSGSWSTHSVRKDGSTNTGFNNKVFKEINYGSAGQSALSSAITNTNGLWTSAHKQSGRAHIYLLLKWDATLYPEGIPDFSFLIRGKKVYNPITTTTAWSNNAALCVADFLTDTTFGLGVPFNDVNWGSSNAFGTVYHAANISAESVGLLDGGSESRYTINGAFSTSTTPQDTLDELLTACGGNLTFVNGLWKLFVAAYRSPSITLDEDNIRGPLNITTRISRKDNFNGIKGTFINPSINYQEDDFPAVKNSYYASQDGFENLEDIKLPFTTSAPTAQRLAKIELERIRQPITVDGLFDLTAFKLEPMDTVYFSLSRLGWSSKIFEVQEVELSLESGAGDTPYLATHLLLRETASGIYDWASGSETRTDLAPNTILPNPFDVSPPSNLTAESGTSNLYLRADGTVFTRLKVSWTALDDSFVSSGGKIDVEYKLATSSDWLKAGLVSGDSTYIYILDVQDSSTYDIRARAQNAIGINSAYSATIQHTVVGKTAPPSDVTGFKGSFDEYSMSLSWDAVADLDLSYYELRQGAAGGNYNDAPIIAEIKGTKLLLDIKQAGSYVFYIKAVDTSGNKSTNYTSLSVSVPGPSAVSITATIEGQNVALSWTESSGFWAIANYELTMGLDFEAATLLTNGKATSFLKKADWSGVQRFWVVARDAAGNLGTESYLDVSITAPGTVVNLSAEVVDNNVLLKWSAPSAGTLPLDHYKIYKGAVFSSATLIGQVTGTFCALFEVIAGTYTYWVVAYDSAGNAGEEVGRIAIVNEPPDFVLNLDQAIDPTTGTSINCIATTEYILMPANNTESVEDHYTAGGWSTPQAQVTAGYSTPIEPVPSFARWTKTIDLGTTLGGNLIKFLLTELPIIGAVDIRKFLAYSSDNVTFTEEEASQIYASNFRYVRLKLQVGTEPGASGTPIGGLPLVITYP